MVRILIAVVFLFSIVGYAENKNVNLVTNPNFNLKDVDGKVLDWELKNGAESATVDGLECLSLPKCDGVSEAVTFLKIDPKWLDSKDSIVKLRVSVKIKTDNVKLGDASWKDTRLAMMFADEKGDMVGEWPNVICIKGTTPWTSYKREFNIPARAAKLKVFPVNYGKTGTAYFSDIKIVPVILNIPKKDLDLPKGVGDIWNFSNAWRQKNEKREKICLNDLWQFRPVMQGEKAEDVNTFKGWGWSKVPNIWYKNIAWNIGPAGMKVIVPEYIQIKTDWNNLEQAWYKRDIIIPEDWNGRKIFVEFTMIQTQATVYVDGEKAGEVWFPGGDVDISKNIIPGKKQKISFLVTARPMAKEKKIFMDADRVFKEKISLKIKGIPGDVYIYSRPVNEHIEDIQMRPSVSQKDIALNVKLNIKEEKQYYLTVIFNDKQHKQVKSFDSEKFSSKDLVNGRILIKNTWDNPELWDLDTPENIYSASVILKSSEGEILDEFLPVNFGFREFSIEGKNLLLNGKIVHLRFMKISNPEKRSDKACYKTCLKTCQRLKENGFNSFIWGNYEFTQGAVGYMDGILNAADELGVLQAFTMPHVKDYNSSLTDEKQYNSYKKLVAWLVKRVQNHPSVVFYAMNHNTLGYNGDENPLKIDGDYKPKDTNARKQCAIAAKIVKELDPTRVVYHHHSGLMGEMFTLNAYLNWSPVQEKSDWIEHWSKANNIPLFFVEWGLPHIASWSSYRGPEFIWMCNAFQSIWDSEFAAPFVGKNAYTMTDNKQNGIKREELEWATGTPFNFGALMGVLVNGHLDCHGVQAYYIRKNWPALRTWGVSAILPWDQDQLYHCSSPGMPMENPDKFNQLQQPGIIPDIFNQGGEYPYQYSDDNYKPTLMGLAMRRWNKPAIGYIANSPEHFSASNGNYYVGEMVFKQFVLINDLRHSEKVKVNWRIFKDDIEVDKSKTEEEINAEVGTIGFIPFKQEFKEAGYYKLTASFMFSDGSTQEDSIFLNILPKPEVPVLKSKIALFDPAKKSVETLQELGVKFDLISADSDTDSYDILILGRDSITLNNTLPKVLLDPKGKSILIMEQQAGVLQDRLGFRVQEYGLRKAFIRSQGHPVFNGLTNEALHDWRGSSTLLPSYMPNLPYYETGFPVFNWCGFKNKRVWRCGNVGNIASVIIEKPVKGNWTPLLDGGFDMQYTPLLEYTGENYRFIFSQLDFNARTEKSPVVNILLGNILKYLDQPIKHKFTNVMVIGSNAENLLKTLDIKANDFDVNADINSNVLLVSSNPEQALKWQERGGVLLTVGLNTQDSTIIAGGNVEVKDKQGWCRLIKDFSSTNYLHGISNAELHWRTDLKYAALQNSGIFENEAFQVLNNGKTIMCQIAPWMFDAKAKPYLRTTKRRVNFLLSQLLFNIGANANSVLLDKLNQAARLTSLSLVGDKWKGKADKENVGRQEKWFAPSYDDSAWEQQIVPGWFEDASKEVDADYQGNYWYKLHINIPETLNNGKITINFGAVDDESWIWFNDTFLGEVSSATGQKEFWAVKRKYDLDPNCIKWNQENVITVLCKDNYLKGGIQGNVKMKSGKGAWLSSYYIQVPEKDDDPYRYYRW